MLCISPYSDKYTVPFFTLISDHVFEHDPYHTGIGFDQFPIPDNWILYDNSQVVV